MIRMNMDVTFRLESRQLSPEQEAEELVRFLKEDPKWKRGLNVAAVCAMSAATFVFAFYA